MSMRRIPAAGADGRPISSLSRRTGGASEAKQSDGGDVERESSSLFDSLAREISESTGQLPVPTASRAAPSRAASSRSPSASGRGPPHVGVRPSSAASRVPLVTTTSVRSVSKLAAQGARPASAAGAGRGGASVSARNVVSPTLSRVATGTRPGSAAVVARQPSFTAVAVGARPFSALSASSSRPPSAMHALDEETAAFLESTPERGDSALSGPLRASSALSSQAGDDAAASAAGGGGSDALSESGPPMSAVMREAMEDIDHIRSAAEAQRVPEYRDVFEDALASEEIVVGLVSDEELAARERAMELERVRAEEEEARRVAVREAMIAAKEERARARVLTEKAELAERIRRRDAQTADTAEARTSALHRVFRRAEAALKSTLAAQHAVVSEKYGELVPGRAGARLLRIEWHKLPQPVEMRIHKIRAVKNKLPAGRYVMLVTLYDRLGGNPLRWTKMGLSGGGGDATRPGATTAVRHRGRFYDTELAFGQCIYSVAPSQVDLRPSNVFVFELFLLGGKSNPIDRVVAWSAVPASDRDFQVVWGRFKLPLMRGEVDLALDKFRAIETQIGRDLDNWLGNMYVEIVHLPRETTQDGVLTREFDVEIAFTSELLRIRGEHRAPRRWAEGSTAEKGPRKRGGATAADVEAGEAAALAEAAAAEAEEEAESDSEDSEASGESDGLGDDSSSSIGGDDWESDGGAEELDELTGGPAVVADTITREDVIALGPVDSAPSTTTRARRLSNKMQGAVRFAARLRRSIDGPASAAAAATAVSDSSPSKDATPARPSSRAHKARAAADYWRSRAAAGAPGSVPEGENENEDAEEDERTPLNRPTGASTGITINTGISAVQRRISGAGVGTAGRAGPQSILRRRDPRAGPGTSAPLASVAGFGVGSTGPSTRLGGAFAIEAARGRNLLGRAAAVAQNRAEDVINNRLGLARKPVAGALTGTQIRATLPGSAAVAERGRALGAGSGLSSYTYAVNKQEGKGLRGARIRESIRKLRFLQHEVVADLHPTGFLTFDFWIQVVIMIVALWLRIYIHYLGEYLYLRSLRVPVYELRPLPYAATLKYAPDVLPQEVEIGVVIMGPTSVTVVFGGFMIVSWVCQRVLGYFPEVPSRFIAFYGVGAVLNPLLITAIDAMAGRFNCQQRYASCAVNLAAPACECSEGDAWKLSRRFTADEGSGVVGIVLTMFIYVVLMLLALFLLYIFMLHLHLNGRMIDLFRRLHAEEHKFLLPADFEVSAAEIRWIVSRAARWRGPHGSTRKVAVCDYELKDPLHPTFKETTTHLIIYHAALDGKRELYRHFLRMPDGSVLEVFGSMERTLGVASGQGTSALQDLLMTHAKADDEQGVSNFFAGL